MSNFNQHFLQTRRELVEDYYRTSSFRVSIDDLPKFLECDMWSVGLRLMELISNNVRIVHLSTGMEVTDWLQKTLNRLAPAAKIGFDFKIRWRNLEETQPEDNDHRSPETFFDSWFPVFERLSRSRKGSIRVHLFQRTTGDLCEVLSTTLTEFLRRTMSMSMFEFEIGPLQAHSIGILGGFRSH